MVLYGFKKKFALLVENGYKPHTIRDDRKTRHARPGEALQLYAGLRTKQCRKLIDPDPICWAVLPIKINSELKMLFIDGMLIRNSELAELIRRDGFDDSREFWEFFQEPKPRSLICWREVDYLKRFLI
jgi:hypothetical protein